MRFLILTFLFTGCITTGPKSGLSPEAEDQLTSLGPKFNTQFHLDGSSISLEQHRQLDVRLWSSDFAAMKPDAQAALADKMARWLWQHYGKEVGLEGIRIRPRDSKTDQQVPTPIYRFSKDELERNIP